MIHKPTNDLELKESLKSIVKSIDSGGTEMLDLVDHTFTPDDETTEMLKRVGFFTIFSH